MMDSINFNLANVKPGVASRAPKTVPPAAPVLVGPQMDKDVWKSDDYARRHREAFAVKEPPKSSDGPHFGLSWKLDEMTTVKLKPSLKKFKIELIKKF